MRSITRTAALIMALLMATALTGCANNNEGSETTPTQQASVTEGSGSAEATAATDESVSAEEVTGEFTMTTADGAFSQDGSKYTVTAAGTYSLRGALEGQIVVAAGEADEVVLELNGTTISNSADSPIKILSADKVEISAKKGTGNVINDARSEKTADSDQGDGAIYAKTDLKLKGSGTLVVNAGYNNGVQTSKDLTVQKLSLKVTAVNNALKGNDSITVKSGTVVLISTKGDGMETSSTDTNKSGGTRGDVTLLGGSIAVYAAGDGIQAAHDFTMQTGEEGYSPNVAVFTGSYSGYTADSAATTSYKGVKADNAISVSAGVISVSSYDDGLHANYGTTFDSGETGLGSVSVTGGSIIMAVYSPEGKTAGGHGGPGGHGGWGGQQAVSGADGIHADGELNISGGSISIDSAYEGLEANVINVSGGTTVIAANDDGINACKGQASPLINVTGGILDVSVPANGDVDGIDSNGSYTQSGGIVITRGPNSEMAAAIDAESSVSVTGGTLIVLGYGRLQIGSSVSQTSLSLHGEGSHSITAGGVSYSFTNAYSYGQTLCVSDTEVSGS